MVYSNMHRGLAKVFGELITLVEVDKRIRIDASGKRTASCKGLEVTLPYSGERFGARPRHGDVIGTMNIARSACRAGVTTLEHPAGRPGRRGAGRHAVEPGAGERDHLDGAGAVLRAALPPGSAARAKALLNVFSSRRGNWEVMLRGLFTNNSVHNLLAPGYPAETDHRHMVNILPRALARLWRAGPSAEPTHTMATRPADCLAAIARFIGAPPPPADVLPFAPDDRLAPKSAASLR
ncbi:hypothetical protein [Paracoccus mutanolyticus]|uniref:hypothetical protein n=1 Tax=Paracoccus mutanolyticus TaxID=1499308 RepID=UPI00294FF13A|nr:hypothetical protein [Paracoccus mutanolyticus]